MKVITEKSFNKFCKSIKKYWPENPTAQEIDDMHWPEMIEVQMVAVPRPEAGQEKVKMKVEIADTPKEEIN